MYEFLLPPGIKDLIRNFCVRASIDAAVMPLQLTSNCFCQMRSGFIYPIQITARKVPKYGFFSGPYSPLFGVNTEKTPYGVIHLVRTQYFPEN